VLSIPGFTVVHELTPRFRDSDAMGHVNNAVYVTYLEVARQEYWRRLTDSHDYGRVPFILAHVSIDFRAEALVHDVLVLGIRCPWVGNRSFGFEYAIHARDGGRRVVEATSVQVFYDYATKSTQPCPPEWRARLQTLEGRDLAREPRS
jgi:acyl-CoA thioester hydrolase